VFVATLALGRVRSWLLGLPGRSRLTVLAVWVWNVLAAAVAYSVRGRATENTSHQSNTPGGNVERGTPRSPHTGRVDHSARPFLFSGGGADQGQKNAALVVQRGRVFVLV